MYGWRARIGFLGPSSTIDTPAYEFYRMAPPGVAMVGTIMGIRILTDDDIERALQELDRVAQQYSREKRLFTASSASSLVRLSRYDISVFPRVCILSPCR